MENPHHKRGVRVQLTERGQAILKKVCRIQVKWANQVSSGIRERDVKKAVTVLHERGSRLKRGRSCRGRWFQSNWSLREDPFTCEGTGKMSRPFKTH